MGENFGRWSTRLGAGALTLALVLVTSGCNWLVRASVPFGAETAVGASDQPALSADGRYVAFGSWRDDLMPGDTNSVADVFRRDLVTGTTELVSATPTGGFPNGGSSQPTISADGRYVAFVSSADDLVAGVGDGAFVRDMVTGTVEAVPGSVVGSSVGGNPSISADGNRIAFVGPDPATPGRFHIYLYDRTAVTTVLVSVSSSGGTPNASSGPPSISADGDRVAFASSATDLVVGVTTPEVAYVRDLVAGTTTAVSVDHNGAVQRGRSPSADADGSTIAFLSRDPLVAGLSAGTDQVYVRDLVAGTTELATPGVGGGGGDASTNSRLDISDDGRVVLFWSGASNLVAGDDSPWDPSFADLFARDLLRDETVRVNENGFGTNHHELALDTVPWVSLDATGQYAAFAVRGNVASPAGAPTLGTNVWVRSTFAPVIDDVAPDVLVRGTTTTVTITGDRFGPGTQVLAAVPGAGPDGLTAGPVTVVSPTELTAEITVAPSVPLGPIDLGVSVPGPGPGVMPAFADGTATIAYLSATVVG